MKTIEELINQLRLFSSAAIDLHLPTDEESIIAFEHKLSLKLPQDYKTFIKYHNGLSLMGTTIYGIANGSSFSLNEAYQFEHYEVGNPMPDYLIPFSPDGAGNHYCFDMRTCDLESCAIVFWQHDLNYIGSNEPEVVNPSFANWVKEVVIDWTLKDYDYNGEER